MFPLALLILEARVIDLMTHKDKSTVTFISLISGLQGGAGIGELGKAAQESIEPECNLPKESMK